jgi:predicted DNA-binding transcriptional regulator AlpA
MFDIFPASLVVAEGGSDPYDEMISLKEVRELFGGKKSPLHHATVYRQIEAGAIPKPYKIGSASRWSLAECLAARLKMREPV